MDSENCPRGISCLPLDICNFPKILQREFYAKYPIPGGQGLNNVLPLLRTSLELLCHISYLFPRWKGHFLDSIYCVSSEKKGQVN